MLFSYRKRSASYRTKTFYSIIQSQNQKKNVCKYYEFRFKNQKKDDCFVFKKNFEKLKRCEMNRFKL